MSAQPAAFLGFIAHRGIHFQATEKIQSTISELSPLARCLRPKSRRGVLLAVLTLIGLSMGLARAQNAVPLRELKNPVAGFSLQVPEDWTMGTGSIGESVIGLNYPLFPSFFAPLIIFKYVPGSPAEAAKLVSQLFTALSAGPPQARPTGNAEEWEVTATIQAGMLQPFLGRWLCRRAGALSYVAGALVPMSVSQEWAQEIQAALQSVRPLPQGAPLAYFTEPQLGAFRLIAPRGWKYEGQVVSGPNVPAAYVFRLENAAGTTGCFMAPPRQLMTGAISRESLYREVVLGSLQEALPDARLQEVHSLPRASQHYTLYWHTLSPQLNIQCERGYADIIGTRGGVPVRVRVEVYAHFYVPLLAGLPGALNVLMLGAWAPVEQFDALYPLARSVLASLWETPMWKQRLRQTTQEVLDYRNAVVEKAAQDWDAYIRSKERVRDPDTGEYQEVPYGPGEIVKDADGRMYRLPEGADVPGGMKRVRSF